MAASKNDKSETKPPPTDLTPKNMSVLRFREENRRAIAAMKNAREGQTPSNGAAPVAERKMNNDLSSAANKKYGKRLSDLTLNFSRRRGGAPYFFAAGAAGCVAAVVTTSYLWRGYEEEEETRRRMWNGTDAGSVVRFLENGEDFRGVALRLVGRGIWDQESMHGQRRKMKDSLIKTLSVVCSEGIAENMVKIIPKKEDGQFAYWRLGRNVEDWLDMPITSEWFLRPKRNDGTYSRPMLLVEADVSISLPSYLASTLGSKIPSQHNINHQAIFQQSTLKDSGLSMDKAFMCMHALELIISQKGIFHEHLNGTESHHDDSLSHSQSGIVPIIIGSGRPNLSDAVYSKVYIDSVAAVSFAMMETVERAYLDFIGKADILDGSPTEVIGDMVKATEKVDTHENKVSQDSILPEIHNYQPKMEHESALRRPHFSLAGSLDTFFQIEWVGQKIRQACQWTIDQGKGDEEKTKHENSKTLHLFSDNEATYIWVEGTLKQKGWNIVWHKSSSPNSASIVREMEDLPHDIIALMFFSTDEQTCNTAMSIRAANPKLITSGRAIALVQQKSSQENLEAFMGDKFVQCICISSIHGDLFEHARALIADGESPSQTEMTIQHLSQLE